MSVPWAGLSSPGTNTIWFPPSGPTALGESRHQGARGSLVLSLVPVHGGWARWAVPGIPGWL